MARMAASKCTSPRTSRRSCSSNDFRAVGSGAWMAPLGVAPFTAAVLHAARTAAAAAAGSADNVPARRGRARYSAVQQRLYGRVGQPVVGHPTGPPETDEAVGTEEPQLVADGALADARQDGQVAHAQLFPAQGGKQPEA